MVLHRHEASSCSVAASLRAIIPWTLNKQSFLGEISF